MGHEIIHRRWHIVERRCACPGAVVDPALIAEVIHRRASAVVEHIRDECSLAHSATAVQDEELAIVRGQPLFEPGPFDLPVD